MHATLRQLSLWLLLSVCAAAAQQVDDPANLMGERVSPPALADTLPINHGAPALEQLLRKLRTRASMMLIVAHPDDEDGGLLTYESRGMGARVAMLTLTRGEGGQNLMSADFNDALGLIRTQELLAADRYMGVDQMFGTEVDFGFSKTKEETLKKWGHDRVLYDAVRAVRLYRPLVLASVFVGGVTDGHGHHQVAGEICQEVFTAAADPKIFPEMGLPAWAPLRVYARVPFARVTDQGMFDYATGRWSPPKFHNYVTGEDITHEPVATVTIHEGDKPNIPAFEGDSYVQFARRGLAMQKSQIGPGVRVPPAGVFDVGYTLVASRVQCAAKAGAPCLDSETWDSAQPAIEGDLFSGIDASLPTIADLAPSAPASLRASLAEIETQIAQAQRLYDSANVELTAPPLREALKRVDQLIARTEKQAMPADECFNVLHELRIKRVQLNNALVLALGLRLEVAAHVDRVLTSQSVVSTSAIFSNEGRSPVPVIGLLLPTATDKNQVGFSDVAIPSGSLIREPADFHFTSAEPDTRPYFWRRDLEQPYYDVATPALRNAPTTPAPLVATARIWAGVELELKAISHSPVTDSGVAQAVMFVPPITIGLSASAGIMPRGAKSLEFTARVNADEPVQKLGGVMVFIETGSGARGRLLETAAPEELQKVVGKEEFVGIRLGPDEFAKIQANPFTLRAAMSQLHKEYSQAYRPVGYSGLTYTNYYTPATYKVTAVDVTTAPNLHIAYLPGTGDEVPQFLPSLGVTPTILAPKDLTAENLKQYDAIVLGVRAYAAHSELSGAGSKPLNDYAAKGGVVVVQYNSGGFNPASAPFPYTLPGDSAHNVVEEDQPVTLLRPDAPLLTWPNRITSADFNGWIEERGHGFASEWAKEYEPLLETHDVDQDPQKGGLLVAKVGKGAYIYCALALYRQLPEGVPGAYRLFANLLSYAKNPKRE
jgi:LmbE family N-acetylglucosaminyl deacetylase